MSKSRSHFVCRECGGVQTRWMGKCPDCGAWDGLERFVEPKAAVASAGGALAASLAAGWSEAVAGPDGGEGPGSDSGLIPAIQRPIPIGEVASADVERIPSGIGELDRVLGGGFVPGSVVLVGGEPGIGKSTLLLQAAASLAETGRRVLYVSSEESAFQSRLRAERLFDPDSTGQGTLPGSLDDLYIFAETNLGRIIEAVRTTRPAVLVLDSIQMVHHGDLDAAPGSVAQLRRCCAELVNVAKITGLTIAMVGHVTKEGSLAGPKLLEHLVDAVIAFEGDRHHGRRVVQAVKNRYGPTQEAGVFEMTGRGLVEVPEAGAPLDPEAPPVPGSVLCPVIHGTRCMVVEIQALTAPGFPGNAKRRTSGLDASRLAMLIAVLEQHGGLRLGDQDVFASAAGGLRVVEPAADLALCLAIASAHYRKCLPSRLAVTGEVGLGGEVRAVHRIDARRSGAGRLGCDHLVTGPIRTGSAGNGCQVVPVRSVSDAIALLERGEVARIAETETESTRKR